MKKTKRGFTIVELVIVIAVIAILAAILIPVFSNVADSAKTAQAQAEVKNAYTAFVADLDNDATKNAIETYYYVQDDVAYEWDTDEETVSVATYTPVAANKVGTYGGYDIYKKS